VEALSRWNRLIFVCLIRLLSFHLYFAKSLIAAISLINRENRKLILMTVTLLVSNVQPVKNNIDWIFNKIEDVAQFFARDADRYFKIWSLLRSDSRRRCGRPSWRLCGPQLSYPVIHECIKVRVCFELRVPQNV
jgi:hypothetical protein